MIFLPDRKGRTPNLREYRSDSNTCESPNATAAAAEARLRAHARLLSQSVRNIANGG